MDGALTVCDVEFIAAYNLLIHLVRQSPNLPMFLPKICAHLSAPITSSPLNGGGLALSVLSTVFNTLPQDHSEMRYHILLAVLRVIRATSNFETLRPQLKQLDKWLEEWEMEDAEASLRQVGCLKDAEGRTSCVVLG